MLCNFCFVSLSAIKEFEEGGSIYHIVIDICATHRAMSAIDANIPGSGAASDVPEIDRTYTSLVYLTKRVRSLRKISHSTAYITQISGEHYSQQQSIIATGAKGRIITSQSPNET